METHPHFIPNATAGSRRETAVLLVGTAEEFDISQQDIASTHSGFYITDALADLIYAEDADERSQAEADAAAAQAEADAAAAQAEADAAAAAQAEADAAAAAQAEADADASKKTSGNRAAKTDSKKKE